MPSLRPAVLVREADPDEYLAVARVLAAVFHDDPMYAWLVPNRRRRLQAITNLFETACNILATVDSAAVWTTDGILGGAIWTPPGQPDPTRPMRRRMVFDMIFGLRWGLVRQMQVESALTAIKEPHWYLNSLGVAGDQRGRGVGSALMAPVMARCDAERLAVYLNTNSEANVRFYRGHGFEVIREVDLAGGRIHLYEMRRAPKVR